MPSEFDLIRRHFARPASHTLLGIGDDAALITPKTGTALAISTDTLVCGKHFFADVDPCTLGHKSLAVNLSDMAAMGATPRWCLLALTLPEHLANNDSSWLTDFSRGFFTLADKHQVALIGGDTTAGPLNIGVQSIGEIAAEHALRRSGAQLDDDIWVSGLIGDAALALQHSLQHVCLDDDDLARCMPALLTPSARVELGRRLVGLAHSAIDISDGLMADLGHILEQSGKAGVIYLADIPCSTALQKHLPSPLALQCLLAGGDDYELCFTVPSDKRSKIIALSGDLNLPLTRIGSICPGTGLVVKDPEGSTVTLETTGYDHFTA